MGITKTYTYWQKPILTPIAADQTPRILLSASFLTIPIPLINIMENN